MGIPIMLNRPRQHLAYLLRLWPAQSREGTIWHASLENARTGEVLGFATLEQLAVFLAAQTTALAEGQTIPHRNHLGSSRAFEHGEASEGDN